MNRIITISREFGSGGRELGKRLSDVLNIKYYDKEIINKIATETGLNESYIEDISNKGVSPYAFQFAKSFSLYSNMQIEQTNLLVKQNEIIKEIAKKESCIIIGRGADVILSPDEFETMNIFVYANMKSKINRCKLKRSDENYTDKQLEKKIKSIDKNRKKYYELVSNIEWGNKENYDLCINTSNIEIKNIVPSIAEYITQWFGGRK